MDPKQSSNQLDPKLKEAYERVMGTMPASSTPPTPTPMPNPAPVSTPSNDTSSPVAKPVIPPMPSAPSQPTPMTNPTPMAEAHSMPTPVTPTEMTKPAATNPIASAEPKPEETESMHATMPVATVTINNNTHPTSQVHGFVAPKKSTGISPVLIIVGGIVFLIAYTLIWVKFFNISLPFLPQ